MIVVPEKITIGISGYNGYVQTYLLKAGGSKNYRIEYQPNSVNFYIDGFKSNRMEFSGGNSTFTYGGGRHAILELGYFYEDGRAVRLPRIEICEEKYRELKTVFSR